MKFLRIFSIWFLFLTVIGCKDDNQEVNVDKIEIEKERIIALIHAPSTQYSSLIEYESDVSLQLGDFFSFKNLNPEETKALLAELSDEQIQDLFDTVVNYGVTVAVEKNE